MEPIFRSRGIRIFCHEGKLSFQEKIYYEPDERCSLMGENISNLQSLGLISLFEYSMVDDVIDTYNFHVNLINNDFRKIYEGLSKVAVDEFARVRKCFGLSFQNYTVGYRFKGSQIVNQSYYFYPTIWKKNRYGIKGIIDSKKIIKDIDCFFDKLIKKNEKTKKEIHDFATMLYKFKGISLHLSEDTIGYKLYGRIDSEKLRRYILQKYNYDICENFQYGECVLVALRIEDELIKGYNLYYLS